MPGLGGKSGKMIMVEMKKEMKKILYVDRLHPLNAQQSFILGSKHKFVNEVS
jgi:hypothetical protein